MTNKQIYLQDKYASRAQREGFKARSAYKLLELQEKFNLILPGQTVVDLGCAPGSWLQVSLQLVGSEGKVIGIDKTKINLTANNLVFYQLDLIKDSDKIISTLPPAHIILSDLAPSTSGIAVVDNAKSLKLAQTAWNIARKLLLPQGNFVCKVFSSKESDDFFKLLKPYFASLSKFKPKASRKSSKEYYIVGQNLKQRQKTTS